MLVSNQLFVVLAGLLAAALFAPPVAANRLAQLGVWLKNTRFARVFTGRCERDAIEQIIVLDLMAAALNSGMAIPAALRAVELSLDATRQGGAREANNFAHGSNVGSAKGIRLTQNHSQKAHGKRHGRLSHADNHRGLDQVAASLLMGATWDEAWEGAAKEHLILYDVLAPAWEDGAAPVPLLERTGETLRLTHQSRANAAAGRLGARLVAPLALCFLPAFMLIGVVPILVLAAQQIF